MSTPYPPNPPFGQNQDPNSQAPSAQSAPAGQPAQNFPPPPQQQPWGPPPGAPGAPYGAPGSPSPYGYPAAQYAQPASPLQTELKQATLFLYIAAGLIGGSLLFTFIAGFMTPSIDYSTFEVNSGGIVTMTVIAGILQIAGWVMLFLSLWKNSTILKTVVDRVK